MPSPFPGMDPYLENQGLWRGVHQGLITFINQQLNDALPPGFAANMDERPDPAHEVREPFIEIVTATPERQLVAVVEVLSPTSKVTDTEGYEEYRQKQRHVLRSAVHLLEIDLRRAGALTVALPRSLVRTLPPFDYLVCLSRARRGRWEFWDNRLSQRLPTVAVPLFEEMPDVQLDLQAAFDRMYDSGPYRRLVHYDSEPEPPLSAEAAAWADALLKAQGLRAA